MPDRSDLVSRLSAESGAELLGAGCEAFEVMLAVIRRHDQPGGRHFLPMVRAGAAAGTGRDCLLFAPSLEGGCIPAPRRIAQCPEVGGEEEAAQWLGEVCRVLVARLGEAARSARLAEDRAACRQAADCAREIAGLLGGDEP